jgi:hypothetical protein
VVVRFYSISIPLPPSRAVLFVEWGWMGRWGISCDMLCGRDVMSFEYE